MIVTGSMDWSSLSPNVKAMNHLKPKCSQAFNEGTEVVTGITPDMLCHLTNKQFSHLH